MTEVVKQASRIFPVVHVGSSIQFRKPGVLLLAAVAIILIYMVWTNYQAHSGPAKGSIKFTDYASFDKTQHNKDWFLTTCVQQRLSLSLEGLPQILDAWKKSQDKECKLLYKVFTSIFSVRFNPAKVVIPVSFEDKVRGWLGNNEELFQSSKDQSVIFIYNEYTREENTFNPIRDKRPQSRPQEPEKVYVDRLSKETAKNCDFCLYHKFTAEESFGRIISNHSVTAANTFKLDTWHSLVLSRTHHPHNWNLAQFMDLFHTAQKWFVRAQLEDEEFKFPSMIWDLLPHAGASQVHPHLHVFLDRIRYQGAIENWRRGAKEYTQKYKRNYFQDLMNIHSLLGLSVRYGTAVAFANLVPKKENEIVVMSDKPNEDFFKLIYFVLRAYIDDMEKLCFSSGYAFPSMDGEENEGGIPVFARLVTRGAVADIRSDISSLELFTATNANTDPFKVIKFIEKSVNERRLLPNG